MTATPHDQEPHPRESALLSSAERRRLMSRGQRLRARLGIGRRGVSEAFLAEVRGELDRSELIKIRVDAQDREELRRLADELVQRVPCMWVGQVGRVIMLYRPRQSDGGAGAIERA